MLCVFYKVLNVFNWGQAAESFLKHSRIIIHKACRNKSKIFSWKLLSIGKNTDEKKFKQVGGGCFVSYVAKERKLMKNGF